MASRLSQAEVWLLERPRPDKRRPARILSRPSLIAAPHTATHSSWLTHRTQAAQEGGEVLDTAVDSCPAKAL